MSAILYVLLGILAGAFSGFFGIGGGIVMVPILVLLSGLTQHEAQGTALAAMVPPVALFSALKYYESGNVKLYAAIFISAGLLAGGYIGGYFANQLAEPLLKKAFGLLLLFVSLRLLLFK